MSLKRVFLVENHEDTVRYIRMFLEHFGYEVGVARDMAEALRENLRRRKEQGRARQQEPPQPKEPNGE